MRGAASSEGETRGRAPAAHLLVFVAVPRNLVRRLVEFVERDLPFLPRRRRHAHPRTAAPALALALASAPGRPRGGNRNQLHLPRRHGGHRAVVLRVRGAELLLLLELDFGLRFLLRVLLLLGEGFRALQGVGVPGCEGLQR